MNLSRASVTTIKAAVTDLKSTSASKRGCKLYFQLSASARAGGERNHLVWVAWNGSSEDLRRQVSGIRDLLKWSAEPRVNLYLSSDGVPHNAALFRDVTSAVLEA